MKIGFLTFDQFRNKRNTAGSRIRCDYVAKELNKIGHKAERFIQGKKYDVVILQKSYWGDYIKNFNGIKILDICDADYLVQLGIIDHIDYVDHITVSTKALKEDIKHYTKTPISIIKDRFDLSELPKPKKQSGKAKKVVWFGNSENLETLDQVIPAIKRMGLELIVISNGNYREGSIKVKNIEWKPVKYYTDIQKADIAVLPRILSGRYKYKSNNKKVLSILLGVPVAETKDQLEELMNETIRAKAIEKLYPIYKKEYNCKKSAKDLLNIINKLNKKNVKRN